MVVKRLTTAMMMMMMTTKMMMMKKKVGEIHWCTWIRQLHVYLFIFGRQMNNLRKLYKYYL